MEIIKTNNINEARKQIQKIKKQNPEEKIIVKAQDEEFNRKIIENKDVGMLLSPESNNRKDKLKQRDSGLNEVLAKLAKENCIEIGMTLEDITKKEKKEKAIILSRIIQNIMLCKKTGAKIKLIGKYDKKDAFSLLLTLGASTQQAKMAVE